MNYKIHVIKSSNQRPVDHPEFKGDLLTTWEELKLTHELWRDIVLMVQQGHRIIIERNING